MFQIGSRRFIVLSVKHLLERLNQPQTMTLIV